MKAEFLKKYFWDTDFKNIDPEKHKTYVIERILEYGDEKSASWLTRRYAKKDIKRVLEKSRKISPKSRQFWTHSLTKQ